MRKFFYILFIPLLLLGCGNVEKEKPVIVIDDLKIYKPEFDAAVKDFMAKDTHQNQKEKFVDYFITRKLILKEAEKMNLDKDKELLIDLQMFWEKSLYKLVIERKMKELSGKVAVSDIEIEEYYNKNKDTDFSEIELKDVYSRIKWLLTRQKEQAAIEAWVNGLRTNADIIIDEAVLTNDLGMN